ncbi:hypothetical protein HZA57_01900 [Candidatus Poribacteria bacterium]|nr:hypothetical protein [Candidatus Poribacteria bacterium]
MGLLVEKARSLIRLHQEDEAEAVIRRLNGRNPLDPQVQLLNSQLRTLRNAGQARTSEVSRKLGLLPPALEDVMAAIHAQIDPLGRVLGIALLDLDSGRSCIEGEEGMAEAGQVFYEKAAQACDELDQGSVQYAVIELQKALVTTYLRGRHLLILGVDPAVNFGKLHHRIQIVLKQQIPVAEPVVTDSAEADSEE